MSDVYGPIGNPHGPECLCDHCGPTEYALNVQAEQERLNDERARIAKSQAMSNAVRAHREKWDAVALAEDDRYLGISYRIGFGMPVASEEKRWHDRVLAERCAKYARTQGES